MSGIEIVEINQLTTAIAKNFPEDFIEQICDDFDNLSDENLVDADFTYGKISHGTDTLNFIHGFPGDNPAGVIYDDQFKVVGRVGEGMNVTNDLEQWYMDTTKDVTELNMFCIQKMINEL